jgi:hypothetical protein
MTDETQKPADKIPAIFATIHWRSDQRPDGYLPEEVSWLNVVANRHIPELHQELLTEHRRQFPDHTPEE